MTKVKQGWEGRYYEDFEVGYVFPHPCGRTITEADNVWFTLITMNTNEIHFNTDYASKTDFKKPLVNSLLTLAIVHGMSVSDTSQNAINLEWREVKLPAPVYVGDTLYAESEVLSKRESRSRPYMGLVEIKTFGRNQEGKVVIELTRNMMVWKREHSPRKKILAERTKFIEKHR